MSENGGGPGKADEGNSFDARLQAARVRQGLDAPAPANAPMAGGDLGTGLRVGVELVSALAVAVAIGWGLDHWLHTMPAFLCIFVLLGGAAGVLNVWRVVSPSSPPPKAERKG
jgi:ATP synthase protein I